MTNVGRMIYGFCNGYFGRDSYRNKRIEAEGIDWVVARPLDSEAHPQFVSFASVEEKDELLVKWSVEEEYED